MYISGYINYGVKNEEENVFTVSEPHPQAGSYEDVIIELPSNCTTSIDDNGKVLVGWTHGGMHLADEIISTDGNDPILHWTDGMNLSQSLNGRSEACRRNSMITSTISGR